MGQKVKIHYTRLHYAIDVACAFLNRWRYELLDGMVRVIVRFEHDTDFLAASEAYHAHIEGEVTQQAYVGKALRYYRKWGGSWRQTFR